MKIIGIIPARYKSSRLPGKPLADICGKPMVWWVYQQCKKVKEFSELYVATDDKRIVDACKNYGIPTIMTRNDTPNHIHRIWEVSEKVTADYYVSVNGDEPLIDNKNIEKLIKNSCKKIYDDARFFSVYRELEDPAEVMDNSNVKIVLDSNNNCLYQSRNPIPSTKGSLEFKYKKAIGIECFNKKALDFFVNAEMGKLEKIEDIDHLRFIENNIPINYIKISSESLSVDTPKDLDRIRYIISKRRKNEKR